MTQPLVSVLIPVYNRVDLIERALKSAVEQTYQPLEIVVIDNCSSDGTWELVCDWAQRDRRIRAMRNESNLGPARSWQRGWEACRGDYVKVVWSDDWMEKNCVAKCLEHLHKEETQLVFTSVIIHRPEGMESAYGFPGRHNFSREEFFYRAVVEAQMPVSPGCMMAARHIAWFRTLFPGWPKLQQIAQQTGAGTDLLWVWEAAQRLPKIGYIEEPLNHFHAGATSLTMCQTSRVMSGYRWGYRYFVSKLLDDPSLRQRWQHWRPNRFYSESVWRAASRRLRQSIRAITGWGRGGRSCKRS